MRRRQRSKSFIPLVIGFFIVFSLLFTVRDSFLEFSDTLSKNQQQVFAEEKKILEEIRSNEVSANLTEETALIAQVLITPGGAGTGPTALSFRYVNGNLMPRNYQLYEQIGIRKQQVTYPVNFPGSTAFCNITDFGGRRNFPLSLQLKEAPVLPGFLVWGNDTGLTYKDASGNSIATSIPIGGINYESGDFYNKALSSVGDDYQKIRTAATFGLNPTIGDKDSGNTGGGPGSIQTRLFVASKNSPNQFPPNSVATCSDTLGVACFKNQFLKNRFNTAAAKNYEGSAFALKFDNYYINPANPNSTLVTTKFKALGKGGSILTFDNPTSQYRVVIAPEAEVKAEYTSAPSKNNKILNDNLKRITIDVKNIDDNSKDIVDLALREKFYKYVDKSKNYRLSYSPTVVKNKICDFTSSRGGANCPVITGTISCQGSTFMKLEAKPGVGVINASTDFTSDGPNANTAVNSSQRSLKVNYDSENGSPGIISLLEKATVTDILRANSFPTPLLSDTCANNLSGMTVVTDLSQSEQETLHSYYVKSSSSSSKASIESDNILIMDVLPMEMRSEVVRCDGCIAGLGDFFPIKENGFFPYLASYSRKQLLQTATYDAPKGYTNNQAVSFVESVLNRFGISSAVPGSDFQFECSGPGDLRLEFKGGFAINQN